MRKVLLLGGGGSVGDDGHCEGKNSTVGDSGNKTFPSPWPREESGEFSLLLSARNTLLWDEYF